MLPHSLSMIGFALASLSMLPTSAPSQRHDPPPMGLLSYRITETSPQPIRLPRELREISGLAATSDGRILCHDDERGVVYQVDPSSGSIVKEFSVGDRTLRRDYEGIAASESLLYLITSNGVILEFKEVGNKQRTTPRTYATGLSAAWDLEGLCFDPGSRSLLIACKQNPARKHFREIYSFSLRTHTLSQQPFLTLDVRALAKQLGCDDFRPSSIERHPDSGNYIILSSDDPAVVELSPGGTIRAASRLPKSLHPQPEGLTFGPDRTLYISNEGKKYGTLVAYPPMLSRGTH